MPQKYIIDRDTGKKESGAIYVESPPNDMLVQIDSKNLEMDIPIGYYPMYMYANRSSERGMFYLILRSHVKGMEDILMYIGSHLPNYENMTVKLHSRPVLDYKIEDSKKLGGWASIGAIYMREITFPDLGGNRTKIVRKEISKYSGIWKDSSGKIIHRETPDLVTLIQGKTKKKLEELF